MDNYTYIFEEKNSRPHYDGTMFRIVAKTVSPLDPQEESPRNTAVSLDAARAAVRAKIEARLADAVLCLKGWTRQLAEFDQQYVTPLKPSEVISTHRTELVAAICEFREGKRKTLTQIGLLDITFGYMDVRELMVFSLPTFENVNFSFTADDISELFSIMEEAGFVGPFNHWNGAGLFTLSVKPPASQMTICVKSRTMFDRR